MDKDIEAWLTRKIDAELRRRTEAVDPEMYAKLTEQDPVRWGPDSLVRIKAEYPQFFKPTSK